MAPQKPISIAHGPYHIQQSYPDPTPLESHPSIFSASNLLTWSLWLAYILVQFNVAHKLHGGFSFINWHTWAILLGEICLTFQDIILGVNLLFALLYLGKARTRPRYLLISDAAPTIDIFVTCCGEPRDVILDTVLAVLALDYPPSQFRVFILDDGHDDELKMAISALSVSSVSENRAAIRYLSRKLNPYVKSYFKAGNLQFGINETKQLGGSEFIASLDADMIPERDWLRKIVPHLILNGKLALACPPQCYYNVPDNDPLGQQAELDLWFTIYETLNDQLGAAMCTGSGYVVRRSALDEVGGWPQVEAGEDFMCSAVLSNNGWNVAFIREDLQFGLAPDSLRSYIKQRIRWVDSGIEVHKQFGFYLPGSKMTSQYTLMQRGVGILQALREYAPITNILSLVFLPLGMLLSQRYEHPYSIPTKDLSLLWVIFSLSIFAKRMNNLMLYKQFGLRRVANFQSLEFWCSPYSATRCLVSLLPSSAYSLKFESSGSIKSSINERSRIHRLPLSCRILSLDMFTYVAYIIYATLPILAQFICLQSNGSSGSCSIFLLFPGATLKLVECISKISVPLRYMTFPPTVLEREELMEIDDQGTRRPKKTGVRKHGYVDLVPLEDLLGLCIISLSM